MDVPEDARTWKNRGDEYVGKEKYEEAIQCYAYAVQLDPEFTEAWNNYGYVLVKLGRKDDARKVREKINQIKKKKEETIKKSQLTGKKQFGNYLPKQNDPGYIPSKICIISVPVLILGYVLNVFSEYFMVISIIGIIGVLFAYVMYAVNIYESGDHYRFLSIFMLIVPAIPFYLLNTDNIPLAIGALVFGFFLIWLIIFVIVRIKHVFIETRKNPPNIFIAGLSILCMFLVYSAVLAAVIFGTYQTEYPMLSSTECASPNIICKGACYEPCPDGYAFDGSSCSCRAEHTSACGDTPCSSPGVCCKGTCYPACPPGYLFNTYDCRCYGQDHSSWAWIDYLG
jgi:uncharacterized membrane protein